MDNLNQNVSSPEAGDDTEKLAAVLKELESAKATIAELESSVTYLKAQIVQLESSVTDHKAQIVQLEIDKSELQGLLENSHDNVVQLNSGIAELENKNSALTQALNSYLHKESAPTEKAETKKLQIGQTFETNEGIFRFTVAKFNVPGFGEFTSEEAVAVEGKGDDEMFKHASLLAYLVQEKSGVIEKLN